MVNVQPGTCTTLLASSRRASWRRGETAAATQASSQTAPSPVRISTRLASSSNLLPSTYDVCSSRNLFSTFSPLFALIVLIWETRPPSLQAGLGVTPSSMKLQTSYVNGPLTPFCGIGAELKVAVAEAVAQEEPGRGAIGAHLVTLI